MLRDVVARMCRLFGRLLLWCLLLLVLISLPVLGMLGSETGSRWLLERGLGMQRMLTLEVRGGTLLTGMDLTEVRVHTRKSDLYIRRVLARWSLLQLLRGEIDILDLQAEGVTLTLTSPPSRQPVRLPRLILPLALDIHRIELKDVRLRKRGSEWPVAHIVAKGYWRGATVIVDRIQAQEPRYGGLALAGEIRLLGGYPLQASGQLSPRWLTEKGGLPLQVSLSGEIAHLGIKAASRGHYHADLVGTVRPLLPDIPYNAQINWSDLSFPWFASYKLESGKGQLKVIGSKSGLRSQGGMELRTKYTPSASYQWELDTDWQRAKFESLKINGLGGEIKAEGEVAWQPGLSWNFASELSRVDLASYWPVSRSVLPRLDGTVVTSGHSAGRGSGVDIAVQLAGGERWVLSDKTDGVLWAPSSRHKAAISWKNVTRPVPAMEFVRSNEGRLLFEGRRDSYKADFSAGMTTGVIPSGTWRGQLTGSGPRMTVDTLSYAGDAGGMQAGGEVDFSEGVAWQGAVVLDEFQSGWILPDWPGQYSGSLSGQAIWSPRRREISLGDVNIFGQLRDQPLRLDGPIRMKMLEHAWPRVSSTGFKADWAGNSAVLDGGLQEQWSAGVSLDLMNASALVPGLQGRIQGHMALTGSERTPDIMLDLSATEGAYAGYALKSARLEAVIPEFGDAHSDISLQIIGATNEKGLALGNLSFTAKGVVRDHQLELALDGAPLSMTAQLAGSLDLQTGNWEGTWQMGQASLGDMQWQLSAPMNLAWLNLPRELRVDGHCWQSMPASFCATEPVVVGPNGRVVLHLKDFETVRLAAFMPEGLSWLAAVEGNVTAEWRQGQAPVAHALLRTGSGEVRLAKDEGEPLSLRYDQLSVALQADASAVSSTVTLASADLGNARLDATINPFAEGRPVTGEVALSGLRLELLQPFLPGLSQLTGLVSADGRLDGSLARPRYWGSVQLKEGKLALRNAPLSVDDMSAWVDVQGDSAEFSGQLRSGEGEASLTGQADWSDQIRVSLGLQGSRFAIRQEPEIMAELNPDLKIEYRPGLLGLTGTVAVPYARINLKKLPERSVGLSPDVRVLESADGRLRASAAGRGQTIAINADVELALGDDVFFNGFGVIGALNGGVHLRQSAQRGLEAYGELGLDKEARYEAYGQKLKVRSGRLVFAGNISQPAIDAEAIREVDSKVVGIRVEGRANAPEATLFSEPTMPQADMLSYLVLGRPLAQRATDGSNAGNDAMLAAAAIKLGAKGGEGLTSGIGSVLGVRDLSLDAEGSGDDTQVKVSGYISPDLYLSYGVGVFTPVNSITMRYQIRPRLYLEAISSIENAIDLFYNFRF